MTDLEEIKEDGIRPDVDTEGVKDVSVDEEPPLQDLQEKIDSGEGTEFDPPDQYLQVPWVPREDVQPNDWNPYYMVDQQYDKLVQSILDNGWTQPIVVRDAPEDADYEYQIVDGEQRWSVAGDARIAEEEAVVPDDADPGYVPIFNISVDDVQAMVSTFQHNENVGEHNMLKMGELLEELDEDDMAGVLADRADFDKFDLKNLFDAAPSSIDYPDPDEYFDLPDHVPNTEDGNPEVTTTRVSVHVTSEQRETIEDTLTSDTHVQALVALLKHASANGWTFDGGDE